MLNSEIGTYQIAEALSHQSKLNALVVGRSVKSIINGTEYVGNMEIIMSLYPKAKLIPKLADNIIDPKRTAIQILKDQYGVKKDKDWELVYNPTVVWRSALAQETVVAKEVSTTIFDVSSDMVL